MYGSNALLGEIGGGGTKGFGPRFGFTVKILCSANAHMGAGSFMGFESGLAGFVVMHGTMFEAGCAARLAIIVFWVFVGAKILLFVSRGTESCASERSPS